MSLIDKARMAAVMTKTHPGVAESPGRFFTRLALWRMLSFAHRGVIVDFPRFGARFYCPPEWRGMSKLAYTLRDYYEPELAYLSRWVMAGDSVIDIGAHYGSYTVPLAKLVGPSGHVFSVEPSVHAREVLRRNIDLNGLSNVTVLDVAAGDNASEAVLHLHADLSRASLNEFENGDAGAENVQVVRLDEVIAPDVNIDFIKIDIEGYELPALRGAANILLRHRPTMLFELQPEAALRGGFPPFGVWDLLHASNYRFSQLRADGSEVSITDPSASSSLNMLAYPD